ncbi:CoA transferase [Candidatus Bathyarchaeota archaeon]|nr:CoA transferase [Candidatus Bathyarchaeota archaeon]
MPMTPVEKVTESLWDHVLSVNVKSHFLAAKIAAMVNSEIALCENSLAPSFATGEISQPLGSRHPLLTPFQIFPTKDGYIVLITVCEDEWHRFSKFASMEDSISDPCFQSHKDRIANYSVFEPLMNEIMKNRTTQESSRALRLTLI